MQALAVVLDADQMEQEWGGLYLQALQAKTPLDKFHVFVLVRHCSLA